MKKITVDGNTVCATVAYALSEVATIYPITPSSTMPEVCDDMATNGEKNIFGNTLKIVELQSEGGASGAMHGSLASGTLTTTFTASQGLLLMIPNMYKIAGELLPCVMHVSARTLATHALSIFGDHSDVMAVRQTGWAMLNSTSVQEVSDMALISHLATLKSSVPFLHFFDGFRTSHELNTISPIDFEKVKKILPMNKITEFRQRGLNSNKPCLMGSAQNPDIFFQNREACNKYYNETPAIVQATMDEVFKITGRQYHLFDYYGHPKATSVIIIMGSGASAVEETVDYLNENGEKVGLIKVRLFRPFDTTALVKALPKSVKSIAVLDRTKEPGSIGEPLYQDVVCALSELKRTDITVVGGRYGLASKEFTPSMANAIFENLKLKRPKNHFTVGINDDVTNTNLKITKIIHPNESKITGCKFYGYGGDGTVSANKNSIKILTEIGDFYGQAYFEYDSKKSGNATISHLRFSKEPVKGSYLLDNIDFVSVHNQTYVTKYNILKNVKNGGTFLLNTEWDDATLEKMLPPYLKKEIIKNKIKFYTIDAYKIAKELGLGNKINLVMQSAFFKLMDIIPYDQAQKAMKEHAKKSYGHKGEALLTANYNAIASAEDKIHKIESPKTWVMLESNPTIQTTKKANEYYEKFIKPIERLEGNELPVSIFNPTGNVPTNTTKYEKRGIATNLPCWNSDACIQCNMCSFVCPHAAIRPHLIKDKNLIHSPSSLKTIDAIAEKGLQYVMQVNPLDCTGCGVCASVCPRKAQGAITMKPTHETQKEQTRCYNFVELLPHEKSVVFKDNTVKGSQFNKPYFEFSGACAGCGETPYIKVITQLFGNKMVVANATGCSSIYGGNAPTCPYAKDENGCGVAWANSLFEDNAEFGYGIKIGLNYSQEVLRNALNSLRKMGFRKVNSLIDEYLPLTDANAQRKVGKKLLDEINNLPKDKDTKEILNTINSLSNLISNQSLWIIGGDGWAYDIGYGGLDHVLASGENVNILVLDTEVYSNTGGQASKSTPMGAVAKFASGGKRTHKKDLALMATNYKDVYVAKVSMGADMNQFLTAIREAEAYNGVSLIIAYAPCINHGINMENSQLEMKKAVESGYWNLWRYNPTLAKNGQNPFVLDSKAPTLNYQDFLMGEVRYSRLTKSDSELAKKLFNDAKLNSERTYNDLKKLSETPTE